MMALFRSLLALGLLLSMLPTTTYAQTPLWSGILSPSRAVDWSNAGVIGGIPSATWTQCGSTIAAYGSSGTPASPATINNALAACSPNTFVLLGAGTFYLSAGIFVKAPHGHVVLRGSGADQTFLIFYGNDPCGGNGGNLCAESSDVNWYGGPSNKANWTAGYAAGTTTITLSSVPNMHVGQPIMLDQIDAVCMPAEAACPVTTDNGTVMDAASNTTTPPISGQGNGNTRPFRNEAQMVTVTQCDGNSTPGHACASGANITISPGLYMPDFASSRAPGAWWSTSPAYAIGFEDFSADATNDSTANVQIFNCLGCWVKGIRSIGANGAHVSSNLSAHTTVMNSYFFRTKNAATQSYGVNCYGGSDVLAVNNIMQAVASPVVTNSGCPGFVAAYNFSIFNWFGFGGWMMGSFEPHTAGSDFQLAEGNVGSATALDSIHGSHNFTTLFRNYYAGNLPIGEGTGGSTAGCSVAGSTYENLTMGACNNNLTPLRLDSYTRFANIIGNLLGKSGTQNHYETQPASKPFGFPIMMIGLGYHDGVSGKNVVDDTLTYSSLLRWGNCDVIHGFSAANCQWNSGEVPSALASPNSAYSNAVPGSHTLPASFVYATKPSWWPTTKPWPAIGPDVTGGNEPGTGGLAYSIPAEDCYFNVMRGAANGYNASGLPFNENSCYGQPTTTQQPQPPTGLIAAVN